MKLLITCVNSDQGLLGYDLEKKEVFWETSAEQFRVCGATYYDNKLLISGDNVVHLLGGSGPPQRLRFSDETDRLLHSIHKLSDGTFGVVDTGNTMIRVFNKKFEPVRSYNPILPWGSDLSDAIHLNDFVQTPFGIYASCFDHRPWREVAKRLTFEDWCRGGYGLVLKMDAPDAKGSGRVVGCGLNHPHSLTYRDDHLFVCSSSSGEFHRFGFTPHGELIPVSRVEITREHFLRGALPFGDGWILGGSTIRHGEKRAEHLALFLFNEQQRACQRVMLPFSGEIYDILPWKPEIMERVKVQIKEIAGK